MAGLDEIRIRITAAADSLKATLRDVSTRITDMETRTRSSMQAYAGLGTAAGYAGKALSVLAVGMAVVTAAAGALAAAILKVSDVAAKFETIEAGFKTLTGSAEIAKLMGTAVVKLAAASGQSADSVAKAHRTLLAFGISAGQVSKDVEMLAEVAAASGTELSGLAVVFGQVKTKGRLMAQESLQFAERGIGMMELLAKSTGKTTEELLKMQEEGLVSFAMVRKAIVEMTQEGGLAFKGMENYGKTTEGATKAMNAQFTEAARLLGEDVNPALNAVKKSITDFLKEGNEAGSFIEQLGDKFAVLSTVIGSGPSWSLSDLSEKTMYAQEAVNRAAAAQLETQKQQLETGKAAAAEADKQAAAAQKSLDIAKATATQTDETLALWEKEADVFNAKVALRGKEAQAAKKAHDEQAAWDEEMKLAAREERLHRAQIDERLEKEQETRKETLRATAHEIRLLEAKVVLARAEARGDSDAIDGARKQVEEIEKQEKIHRRIVELHASKLTKEEAILQANREITLELEAQNAARERGLGLSSEDRSLAGDIIEKAGGRFIGQSADARRALKYQERADRSRIRGREEDAKRQEALAKANFEAAKKPRRTREDKQAEKISRDLFEERRRQARMTEDEKKRDKAAQSDSARQANEITSRGQSEPASDIAKTEAQRSADSMARIETMLQKHLDVTTKWTENVTSS